MLVEQLSEQLQLFSRRLARVAAAASMRATAYETWFIASIMPCGSWSTGRAIHPAVFTRRACFAHGATWTGQAHFAAGTPPTRGAISAVLAVVASWAGFA